MRRQGRLQTSEALSASWSVRPRAAASSKTLCVRKAIPRTRSSSSGGRSCLRSYYIVLAHAQKSEANAPKASYIHGNTFYKNIFFGKPCLCERFDQGIMQLGVGALLAISAGRRGRLQRSKALPASWSRPVWPRASQTPLQLQLSDALRQEGRPRNSLQLSKTKSRTKSPALIHMVLTHAQRARRQASDLEGNTVDKNIFRASPPLCGLRNAEVGSAKRRQRHGIQPRPEPVRTTWFRFGSQALCLGKAIPGFAASVEYEVACALTT